MGELTALCEERVEDGGAVGGEDAGGDFYLMVEARVGEDFEAGANGAAFGIVGAVDEARDTGLDDGARTHAARLDGNKEGCISKAVVPKKAGGFAQGDDFGVGGGVAIADGAIASTGEDFAVVDDHGADGDFAGCSRYACLRERLLHELDVRFHLRRENNMWDEGNGINTGDAESTENTENTENTEKRVISRCLTIGEGRNKLSACGNSWSDCFKSIF